MLSFVEITQKIIKSRSDRQINENFSKENFSNMSLFDAYSIQKIVINGLNKRVSGWKLGGTNTKTRNLFNIDELYWGPVFNGCITTNPEDIELYCGEVEIALKFNKNIQSISDKVDAENLPKYIDSVALAIEYPQSFISNISEFGVQALISDCCGSGQCLISTEIPFLEFIEAKKNNKSKVELLGTGNPFREFLFNDDLAEAIYFLLKSSKSKILRASGNKFPIFNVGSSENISIRKLSFLIKNFVNFEGKIIFNKRYPDGTMKKNLNSNKIRKLGWKPKIKLKSGLLKVIKSKLI